MEPQTLINVLIGLVGGMGGWILNNLSKTVDDLQRQDMELADKVQRIELLVAGTYVKRDELDKQIEHLSREIFKRLDRIETKIDGKADK